MIARLQRSLIGAMDGVNDRRGHLCSLGFAAEIGSVKAAIGGDAFDGPHQPIAGGFFAQVLEHHHR